MKRYDFMAERLVDREAALCLMGPWRCPCALDEDAEAKQEGADEVNSRTLSAIRAIAERPGTYAEGIAAMEALKRLERASEPQVRVESTDTQESQSRLEEFLSSEFVNVLFWLLSAVLGVFGTDLIRWLISL